MELKELVSLLGIDIDLKKLRRYLRKDSRILELRLEGSKRWVFPKDSIEEVKEVILNIISNIGKRTYNNNSKLKELEEENKRLKEELEALKNSKGNNKELEEEIKKLKEDNNKLKEANKELRATVKELKNRKGINNTNKEEPVITLKEHSERLKKMEEATKKLYETNIKALKRTIKELKQEITKLKGKSKDDMDWKKIYNKLIRATHPDTGDLNEAAALVNEYIKPLRD